MKNSKHLLSLRALILLVSLSFMGIGQGAAQLRLMPEKYVVLARETMSQENSPWKKVIDRLLELHSTPENEANLVLFKEHPQDALNQLKTLKPRYVAVVDEPSYIGKQYIVALNVMSRKVDDDIYKDFMWGIVTGYSPEIALRVIEDAQKPLRIRSLVSTISELTSGKWFDEMVCIEDQNPGSVWIKKKGEGAPTQKQLDFDIEIPRGRAVPNLLKTFFEGVREVDPDLIVTASHATQRNLEMPYSVGNIKCSPGGLLYSDFPSGARALYDKSGNRRKVYLPIGNCLIGDMNNSRNSMAGGWITSGGASSMIGYVVETWYGRAGWGGLKYFLTNAERLSLYPSFLLNEQEILHRLHKELPALDTVPYDLKMSYNNGAQFLAPFIGGKKANIHQIGFFYDRDVLAYYGDPTWDVTLSKVDEYHDYTVAYEYKKDRLIVTLKTLPTFDPVNFKGRSWKSEHVDDLPLAFYFPQRVASPRLTMPKKMTTDYILEENSLLIYNPILEPNRTYKWEIRSKR